MAPGYSIKKTSAKALGDSGHLRWTTGDRRRAYDCAIFSVNEVDRASQDGRKGTFIEVECPKWVVVIPLFKEGESLSTVVERQYRHGSDTVTLEFPAGLVEEGEDPADAAARELLEETGLKPGKMTLLGSLCPNNAFMSNRQWFYLAEDLEQVAGQDLDANEQIDVFAAPLSEVMEVMGSGEADNALMSAACWLLSKELGRRGKENK